MTTIRYREIAEALIAGIESGRYAVGDLLPPEEELARHYRVSRHTAREGIRHLVERGLVERRRGAGTRVVAQRPAIRYVAALNSLADLFRYTRDTRIEILAEGERPLDDDLAAIVHLPAGTRRTVMETCRFAPNSPAPLSYSRLVFEPGFEPLGNGEADPSAHRLLSGTDSRAIAEVVQEIEAIAVTPAIGRLLKVAAQSPALLVVRRFLDGNGAAHSTAVNIYPQKRFRLTTTWRLEESAASPAREVVAAML